MNAFVFVPRHSKQNQCLWNYKAACQPQQYWVSVVLFPDIFVQKIDKTGAGNSCCLKVWGPHYGLGHFYFNMDPTIFIDYPGAVTTISQ